MRAAAIFLLALVAMVPAAGALPLDLVPHAAAPPTGESLLSLPPGVRAADVEAQGVRVLERFDFAGVLLVAGAPETVGPRVAGLGVVAYPVEPLTWQLAESRAAVGAEPSPVPAAEAGLGVAVAVVDSGVDATHPALRDRILAEVRVSERGAEPSSGDASGHGTHVAGIVAGTGADVARHRGIAPGASVVAVDISSSFTTTNAIRAFRYVSDEAGTYGIRIVTNSWGREKEDARHDPNDPLTRAIDAVARQGLLVVFSAGNRGPGPSTLTQEAMNPNVLTVGATDDRGRLEDYSGRGPARDKDGAALAHAKPDVLAPGTAIVSTRAGGGYVTMNGTSMAAPHVAGAAAVLMARFPDLTPEETRALLVERASATRSAAGLLDVRAAFDAAAEARRLVVERRVPLSFAGEFVSVAGRALDVAGAPREDSASIEVPSGARELQLVVRWDAVGTQGLRATLLKDGRAVLEREATSAPIDLLVQGPEPGTWTLRVEPRGAAERASWHATGSLVVAEVEENATAPRPIERARDPGAFEGAPGVPRGPFAKAASVVAAFAVALGIVGVRRRG